MVRFGEPERVVKPVVFGRLVQIDEALVQTRAHTARDELLRPFAALLQLRLRSRTRRQLTQHLLLAEDRLEAAQVPLQGVLEAGHRQAGQCLLKLERGWTNTRKHGRHDA